MNIFWLLTILLLPILGVSYTLWHIWMLLPLGVIGRTVIVGIGLLCFLTLFLDFTGKLDSLPMPVASVLYDIGTSTLIVVFYLVMLFVAMDLGRMLHLVPRNWLYDNWTTIGCICIVMLATFVYGRIHYNNKVRVTLELETTKPIPRDYKILMASDLHLGYHNDRKELARWVDMMNSEHPDLILIAGDIIDVSVRPLIEEDMAAEFHRLQAPVYACLGNHEFHSGAQQSKRFYHDAGIHLLIDEGAEALPGVFVIGRNDRMYRHRKSLESLDLRSTFVTTRQCSSELDIALAAPKVLTSHFSPLTPSLPHSITSHSIASHYTILLDHQPFNLPETERAGFDFQLSGHTHYGQVWPLSWITKLMYECAWGAYRRGQTQYYISSGLGIWGGRFRIGTQSEYVVATLHKNDHE